MAIESPVTIRSATTLAMRRGLVVDRSWFDYLEATMLTATTMLIGLLMHVAPVPAETLSALAVSEPTTMALLGVGLALIARRLRLRPRRSV